ncbi:hypothetical protein [Methylomonas sp. ZR1]|nr:hypothetical protein [Methylomonas sp. ZR1]
MSATVRIVLYIQGKLKMALAEKLTLSMKDYLQGEASTQINH